MKGHMNFAVKTIYIKPNDSITLCQTTSTLFLSCDEKISRMYALTQLLLWMVVLKKLLIKVMPIFFNKQ